MERHGRYGAEERATLSVVALPEPQRPEPPTVLSPRQMEIWDATVASMPNGWFRGFGNLILLQSFCIHSALAEHFGAELDRALGMRRRGRGRPPKTEPPENRMASVGELRSWLDAETRLCGLLASKLRLARQQLKTAQSDGATIRNTPRKNAWDE